MPRSRLVVALAAGSVLLGACNSSTPSATPSTGPGSPAGTADPDATGNARRATPATGRATSSTAPAVPGVVTIVQYQFQPGDATSGADGAVTWTNAETDPPVEHWVKSDRDATPVLDSGRLAAGATYQATLPGPGTYPYYCLIHNNMKGTVVVPPAGSGG